MIELLIMKCDNEECHKKKGFLDMEEILDAIGRGAPIEALDHWMCDGCTIRAMVDDMRDEQMEEGDLPEEVLEGNSLLEIMG